MDKELSIEEIIDIIKKESRSISSDLKEDTKEPSEKKEQLEIKNSYSLDELCKFHDIDFIKNAYIALLKREPDSQGFEKFLKDLRSGEKDKVQILSEIRYSKEGKRKGVKVGGLYKVKITSKLYKIPILGYILKLFSIFLKLPKLIKRINEFEAYCEAKFLQIENKEKNFEKNYENLKANIEALYKIGEDYRGFKEYVSRNLDNLKNLREITESINYLKESIEGLKDNQKISEEMIDSIMRETYARISSFEKDFIKMNEKYENLRHTNENIKSLVLKLQEASMQDFTEFQNFKDNLLSDIKEFKEKFYKVDEDYRGFKEYTASLIKNFANLEDLKNIENSFYKIDEDYRGFKKFTEDKLNLLNYKLSTKEDKQTISKLITRLQEYKIYTLDNQKRLSFILNEIRKRFPKEIEERDLKNVLKEESKELDSLYLLFENRFRGFEKEIQRRLSVYLSLLDKKERVLDLGCGRGEWLSLLKEKGFKARGVDTNHLMISLCKEKELDVKEMDALEFLKSFKDESVGAITGFHIIEHLDFEVFIKILDEAIRILKRGGVTIFETPNPLNLEVGASSFYLDPSHKNPIHPKSASFFMESRGFVNVSYKLVEHNEFESKLKDIKDYKREDFKDYISIPRDYALIGYKA